MKRYIISIQGGMAVGKTTVIKRLEKRLKNINFVYEKPLGLVRKRDAMKLDINTQSGFMRNQRLFINAEVEKYQNLPAGISLFDRGPEDIEAYTLNYPKSINKNWNIEKLLAKELKTLRQCRSDAILFLRASKETLLERKLSDPTRGRSSFGHYLDNLYQLEEIFFKNIKRVEYLDTDHLGIDEMEKHVMGWVTKKCSAANLT